MSRNGRGGPEFDPEKVFNRIRSAPGGGRRLRWALLGLVAVVAMFTTYYQVEAEEVGVVTRLGRFSRISQPGAHFRWPFGIERVAKVPVQRQLKQEFGFRTVRPDVRTEYQRPLDANQEAVMLTGDLNVADVEWIVQYKIEDPYKFLFNVRNVEDTLRDMSEAVMREVVGDYSVSEVLTSGREAIQIQAKEALQRLCDKYGNGVEILQLVLQDVNPPEPVRASFNAVNEAIQERERAINEARQEYNRVIPEARGRAEQAVRGAEGYAAERVNRAEGDNQRFVAQHTEYAKAREVTRTRLYLEAMARVMPAAGQRVLIDEDVKSFLPLLSLGGTAKVGGAP